MKVTVSQLRRIIKEEVEEAIGSERSEDPRGDNAVMQRLRDFFGGMVVDHLTDLGYSRTKRARVLYVGHEADLGGDALYEALGEGQLLGMLQDALGIQVLPASQNPYSGMGEEL